MKLAILAVGFLFVSSVAIADKITITSHGQGLAATESQATEDAHRACDNTSVGMCQGGATKKISDYKDFVELRTTEVLVNSQAQYECHPG